MNGCRDVLAVGSHPCIRGACHAKKNLSALDDRRIRLERLRCSLRADSEPDAAGGAFSARLGRGSAADRVWGGGVFGALLLGSGGRWPATGEDALELAEAEEPGYRIIRRGGSKILIAAFEDDGIVLLSAFRTFREQEEACLRVFASAMRAFSSGESLEEAEETLRETYAAMGDHNTRTLYRGYAQFRLVTEADESAETGGYVYFLIGKS